MLNKCFFQGRPSTKPELSYLDKNGMAYSKFQIAINEKYKNKKTTYWVTILAWGKVAEICVKYLEKGHQAVFECKLTSSLYPNPLDATKKLTRYEFILNTLHLLAVSHKPKEEDEDIPDIPF